MIEQKTIRDISAALRNNYQTAKGAVDKKNTDYAILLLKSIVQKEPGFIEAREELRKVEKIKLKTMGFIGKITSNMKAAAKATKGKTQLNKKPNIALNLAEDALAENLSSLPALNLLAQAGQQLDSLFISIEALEIAVELHPKNINILDWLAEIYADAKMGSKSLQIRQKISSLDPNNMDKQNAVRAAAALATIDNNHLDATDGNYKDMLKDKDESAKMEQKEKIVRDLDDIQILIKDLKDSISGGESTPENHRKLADIYQRGNEHEKALENYHLVVEKMGALDPYIDRSIEKSELSILENTIKEWSAYGEAPENKEEADTNIATIKAQQLDYRKERATERVRLYPNDTELRYNLGLVCWDRQEIDEALQALQIGQKNPSKRLSALVYLGRCFFVKKQFDIAVEQFNTALESMLTMNKEKMNALYYLATTYEAMGNKEKATEAYKEIYQANINYKDVAQKMEALYK